MWRVTHCGWCHSLGWDPELCKWGDQSGTKHFSLWFWLWPQCDGCFKLLPWPSCCDTLHSSAVSGNRPFANKLLHFCLGLWALRYRCELPCLILLACFCFCSPCSIAVLSISLCCCTLYCWVAIFIYVYLNLFVHSHMNGLCEQFGLLPNCQFKDANKNAIFIVA